MTFMEFENIDDMFEFMEKRTNEANANLAPAQQGVTYGDCWARFDTPHNFGFIEFGHVETEAEFRASMVKYPKAETDSEWESIQTEHERGYLFSKAYSLMGPDGELGDTHRASMWPIDRALFDAARAVDWDYKRLEVPDALNLSLAYEQWLAHEKSIAS